MKELDKMLEPIKNSPKFGGEFMSIQEKLYTERRVGMEEGIEVGEKKGRQAERQEIMEKCGKQV